MQLHKKLSSRIKTFASRIRKRGPSETRHACVHERELHHTFLTPLSHRHPFPPPPPPRQPLSPLLAVSPSRSHARNTCGKPHASLKLANLHVCPVPPSTSVTSSSQSYTSSSSCCSSSWGGGERGRERKRERGLSKACDVCAEASVRRDHG